jgi:hypothetical protein
MGAPVYSEDVSSSGNDLQLRDQIGGGASVLGPHAVPTIQHMAQPDRKRRPKRVEELDSVEHRPKL